MKIHCRPAAVYAISLQKGRRQNIHPDDRKILYSYASAIVILREGEIIYDFRLNPLAFCNLY